jgi:hypothetical protein
VTEAVPSLPCYSQNLPLQISNDLTEEHDSKQLHNRSIRRQIIAPLLPKFPQKTDRHHQRVAANGERKDGPEQL